MLVGFTFPAFIYVKLGGSGHAPGLSSNGSLNESVSTASVPLLVPGSDNRRDAVWILSALLVTCPSSLTIILLGSFFFRIPGLGSPFLTAFGALMMYRARR